MRSLHQTVERRQVTCHGDGWLEDTDLPLHFRESELLQRKAPGKTVQGKVRFGGACVHLNTHRQIQRGLGWSIRMPEPKKHRELRMISMKRPCLILKSELGM